VSRTRSKVYAPLTAAQQEIAAQLLGVADIMARRAWRRKWRSPLATPGDLHNQAQLALLQWVIRNTNPDGSDPRRRPPEQFRAHLAGRIEKRLANHRRNDYRRLRNWREWKEWAQAEILARKGCQGRRKKQPNDVYQDAGNSSWSNPKLARSGPVWETLSREADDTADVRELVTAALRYMAARDPEATECFQLRYGEGLKFNEIAKRTGLSEAQVKRRVKKADEIAQKFKEEHDLESDRKAC